MLFSITLFVLLVAMLGLAQADSFEWDISEAGVLTISGSGIIPPSYHPWIDDYQNQQRIIEVHVGEGITEIGDFVFGSYTIPQVRSVTLPNSLEVIGGQNFGRCANLESITLPEGLREIDYCCFWDCDSLTSVTIPSTVTAIGFGAFTHCDSLLNVYVASGNLRFQSKNGVLFQDNSIICYPIGRTDTTYTIPTGTTWIGDYVFSDSTSLEEVVLPNGLQWIGESFGGCSALCRLTLPNTLTGMGYSAFSGCTLLESVIIPDSVTSMGEYVFPKTTTIYCSKNSAADTYAKKNGHHIVYPDGSEYIPPVVNWNISDSGVLTISSNGIIPPSYHPWVDNYQDRDRIIEVRFEEGITNIGDFVMGSGTLPNVRTVILPSTLKVLGGQNFWGYTNLESITLPEGLQEVDYCCFWDCDKLTSVTIPSTVTTIGFGAFTHCNSLQNVYVAAGNHQFQSKNGVLFQDGSLICYPIGRTDKVYTVPAGTTWIGDYVFSDSTFLEEVMLPEGLQWIGESFNGCSSLCRLSLPNTLTGMGYNAFSGCNLIQNVVIPDSVTSMGEYVFPQTTTIICSENTAAERYAKKNGHQIIYKSELKKNTLPTNLAIIEKEAFYNSGFDILFIPRTVIAIAEDSFPQGLIIVCPFDSFANTWARENGYTVINLE